MNLKYQISTFKKKIDTNKQLKQSVTLMLWNFLGMPLGIVTNIVVTRYMGAQSYGDYLYVQRIFDFIFIILGFGILQSINRVVLLSKDEQNTREIYGSGFVCLLCVYLFITAALYTAAFISPNFKEKGIFDLMLMVIPISLIHYTMNYFEQVLPSSNRISELIIARYIPRVAFFLMSFLIYFYVMKVDIGLSPVFVVWVLFWGSQAVVYIYVFCRLKPSLANLSQRVGEILRMDKEYGFHVYVGNLFSTSFTALMPILLSYFGEDNSGVGFYSLSLMLSSPLSFIPVVVATSHYKSFAGYKSIPKKILTMTGLVSLVALAFLWIIIAPFVNIFYTTEFNPVIGLTLITSIGTLLYGFSDFFSRYLMAQGRGKYLRNSSFVVGFSTLIISVILIPWIHETGAALAHMGAGLVYFFIIVYYYVKCVRDNYAVVLQSYKTDIN